LNTRQLSDWAALKARNEEEYGEYEQMMQQALEKKQAITEQAFKVVSQELNQQWVVAEQAKDQAAMEQITGIRAEIKKAQDKARKDAAKRSALWTIGGTALGIAAGIGITIATGGTGAAAIAGGASLGGSLGGTVGSTVAANQ